MVDVVDGVAVGVPVAVALGVAVGVPVAVALGVGVGAASVHVRTVSECGGSCTS